MPPSLTREFNRVPVCYGGYFDKLVTCSCPETHPDRSTRFRKVVMTFVRSQVARSNAAQSCNAR